MRQLTSRDLFEHADKVCEELGNSGEHFVWQLEDTGMDDVVDQETSILAQQLLSQPHEPQLIVTITVLLTAHTQPFNVHCSVFVIN